LASQLGTTPGLVRMMLKQVEQMDMVKVNLNCEGGCEHCGLKSSCKVVKKAEFQHLGDDRTIKLSKRMDD